MITLTESHDMYVTW